MTTGNIKLNKELYFICGGTSINDVIKSINHNTKMKEHNKKDTKKFYNFLFSKTKLNEEIIEEEEFSKLDELGIKEMYMCEKNKKVNDSIINEILQRTRFLYTSLDYSCIESSFILCHQNPNINIVPLPNISSNTNIKNKKTFDIFKKKFGEYTVNNIYEYTNIVNYWDRTAKDLYNNFLNIKKTPKFRITNPIIDWSETKTKDISLLHHYSYSNFKDFFKKKCFPYIKYHDISIPYEYVFLSDSKLIIDILKEIKDIKYKKDIDIVERSSVWKIEITIEIEYNKTTGEITKKTYKYKHLKILEIFLFI
jgi:hypothetical protein